MIVTPKIVSVPSPNHSPRNGVKIQAIVEHITQGGMPDGWFANPASGVSSTYSVAKAGAVHQHVQDSEAAWANGIPDEAWQNGKLVSCDHYVNGQKVHWDAPANPAAVVMQNYGINANRWALSIEHEGSTPDTPQGVQLDASVNLTAWLCQQHGLVPSRQTIIRHSDIGGHLYCPGWSDAFLDSYIQQVKKVMGMVRPTEPLPPWIQAISHSKPTLQMVRAEVAKVLAQLDQAIAALP